MRCVSCDEPIIHLAEPCPHCQFKGDPALVEELTHVNWLLGELVGWTTVSGDIRHRLRQSYTARQRELLIKLGLRLPPFTAEQAQKAWPDLIRRQALLQKMGEWAAAGWLDLAAAQPALDTLSEQVDDLLEQLEGHARPDTLQTNILRLASADFILQAIDRLSQENGFASPEAESQARAPLAAEKERLEIALGLRKVAVPQPAIHPLPSEKVTVQAPPPPAPQAPPLPFRDRLWRTLLSERTLQAMLFLGIFLLFAAAISFVIWGWRDFSAPVRVAIPAAFTTVFFALGWTVRVKTRMYRSGIALTAIAALLIPVDWYTVYANFHILPEYAPAFWFVTSVTCLIAYVVVTLLTQSAIFGYLVGAASGSTVLALIEMAHQSFGLSLDWRTAAISILAVGLILIAPGLSRAAKQWRVMAEPFRNLALITAGVVMSLSVGWRVLDRQTFDTLHYAMSVNWWLGGFIFAWGAIHYGSRSLGLLAALSLPVATFMTQAAWFDRAHVSGAWHALGWAWLVPLYFVTGHRLLQRREDPVLYGHGRTASGWGVALLIVAALWSLTDLKSASAAASSHAVLSASAALAAVLWQRPRYLYGASLLSLTAVTFAMNEWNLSLTHLAVGWISLSIAHVILAVNIGKRFGTDAGRRFARALTVAGYVIAALALVPPLVPYDGRWLAYALGNWLGLSTWGAVLAHQGQAGFASTVVRRSSEQRRGITSPFHWMAALPLPVWIWMLFDNRGPLGPGLALAWGALAWGMVALSYRLALLDRRYRWPWYLTGLFVSMAAPIAAFLIAPNGLTPAVCLLMAGLLYLADAITNRQSLELAPAGLVTAWGLVLLLDKLRLTFDGVTFALTLLVTVYFMAGLWTERKRSLIFTQRFLGPLYLVSHLLALVVLWRVYTRPFNDLVLSVVWTDAMRVWGAACQLLLGIVYGLYAWSTYQERWAYAAAWLGAAGGGFIAILYSTGRGTLAARAALVAIAFVLAERALHWARRKPGMSRRWQVIARLAWRLYRRPLLVTGWLVSIAVIPLALVRNLILLGGGRTQQFWAATGLLLIVGLYALSARLFRQARFLWFAALLLFVPWTILTNLGWFVWSRPTTPGLAVSWVVMGWLLYLIGLLLQRLVSPAYALPLKTVAYALLPFSLVWGIANVDTSRFTFALAIGFYGWAAALDHRRFADLHRQPPSGSLAGRREWTFPKFLYLAWGLIPVWCVYLLAWLRPEARHEHYGLLLLPFGPLGLIAGHWLRRIAPQGMSGAYGLPAYLMGYASVIVGTLLVAHNHPLLALALLYAALLMLGSARVFHDPLWVYPASALVPLSLLLALDLAGIAGDRHGWWLIGLAAIYLSLSWALRRVRLNACGTATLLVGFALIALGLPPSSQDKIGALWGYGSAALLYAISAVWLRQALLLTPACALISVPYAVGLQLSGLRTELYGLALLPGAIMALGIGWWLDVRAGSWRDFPWGHLMSWPRALADRLLSWYALPLYALGFGLGIASPFFTHFEAGLSALNWSLLMPLFGWAIYRFRLRAWLFAMALAGHLAVVYYLADLGWWRYPSEAWLRFVPTTLVTAALALVIERRRGEGSPLDDRRMLSGWSRPLYLLVLLDLTWGQMASLHGTPAGATISLIHAVLIGVLAFSWRARRMPYLSATLGVIALAQWLSSFHQPVIRWPIPLALLAVGYGLTGYGLALVRARQSLRAEFAIWERPLQRFSSWFSISVLLLTAARGTSLAQWTVRAMLGYPFRQIVEMETVQMVVGVSALIGLLYVAAAFTHRRLRLAYLAVGMLLAAWLLHAFYIQQWDGAAQVQWYAIPAGLYLLGIGYLEAQRGNKTLARWLDYLGVLLMMGSLFWQTLLFGWRYALMLGVEGFAAFWWGSARRLRRFLYAGMMGVILATTAQLINSLRSINQWIVFGIIGLLVVVAAIVIERKLEDIKAWREVLETWE